MEQGLPQDFQRPRYDDIAHHQLHIPASAPQNILHSSAVDLHTPTPWLLPPKQGPQISCNDASLQKFHIRIIVVHIEILLPTIYGQCIPLASFPKLLQNFMTRLSLFYELTIPTMPSSCSTGSGCRPLKICTQLPRPECMQNLGVLSLQRAEHAHLCRIFRVLRLTKTHRRAPSVLSDECSNTYGPYHSSESRKVAREACGY